MPLSPLVDLESLGSAASSAASTAASTVASVATGGASTWLTGDKLMRGVIILLGLLLIAGGIFGFDKTREVIVQAGTAAAAAA